MSGRRYLAILPDGDASYRFWRARLAEPAKSSPPLPTAIDHPAMIVIANTPALALGHGKAGLILGDLIGRGDASPCDHLDQAQQRAIVTGGAEHLIRQYWGAYIAILDEAERGVTVLRAPLGDLPAYIWRSSRGLLVASDMDLLIGIGGYAPQIDWRSIAEHLIAWDLRRPHTCLVGIEELGGGTQGHWQRGRWRVVERWSPWDAVPARPHSLDPREVSEHLGAVVRRAVAARTARSERPLVLLSGGIDSSIVAACLAEAGRKPCALTMITRDEGGDERVYAAAVAEHLGIPLIPVERDVARVDLWRSLAQGAPRPTERSFAQATDAAVRALAADNGIDAVIHGGGGDNVFCSLQSAAPVADRLLASGPDTTFWAVAMEIASLAQVSVLRVIERAIARALRRRRPYRFPADYALLAPETLALGKDALDHRWLHAPVRRLPGSAAHIGLVVAAQSVVESPDPRRPIASLAPLITQPIVEACVAIPSWAWYDRGCNRAPARHAFANALPAKIAWRRSKGAMDSFIVEIYEANRAALATLLLDGELASHRLIDVTAIRALLADPGPTRGQSYGRIMQLADVEAWARLWRA